MPPAPARPASASRATSPVEQARLVAALCEPGRLCREGVRLVETHISYVLLTGTHAYKIKKAVKLPFLDFSTLAARREFCEQELRLNRRLASDLYLDVVTISGTVDDPVVDGPGTVLEYAVRMREFPEHMLLSDVLGRNELGAGQVDALAAQVAAFHERAAIAAPSSGYGHPGRILDLALANFAEIGPLADAADRPALAALERWTRREHAAKEAAFARRCDEGAIRECHGDLHLSNIALVDGRITIFDCVEFNDEMRWIDPLSEVAFTVMDLDHHAHAHLAHRFLSAYLECTGDYAGCAVLRFYLVYRAMVRAKVACLRATQLAGAAAHYAMYRDFGAYLRLAQAYAASSHPALVAMHGPSGCGKSTLAQLVVERAGAVRIRTDVERKRLGGLSAGERSGSDIASGLYAPDLTRRTYDRLLTCARGVLQGGATALVDGTFLRRRQRDLARAFAAEQSVPFVLIDCVASTPTLRARVAARARAGTDASEADLAVLAHQLETADALAIDELRCTVVCSTEGPLTSVFSAGAWREVVERVRHGPPAADRPAMSPPDPLFDAKVRFLARPEAHGAHLVEPVETHLSWVFLTEREAYKLKKPVCNALVDLRTLAARQRNCNEELRVNRRFASGVYLGVVALTRDAQGALHVGGSGEPVDWLLRMRRLPADRMLDRVIASGGFRREDLPPVVELLCRAYRDSPTVGITAQQYVQGLADATADSLRELRGPESGFSRELVDEIGRRQSAFLEQHEACLFERVRAARVVEGHGDLRTEHICLEATPQIIDSLEFSRELRTLDAADELGFLALECERLGAPQARPTLFEAYRRATGDSPPPALIDFYQSFRACVRATLAIRHVDGLGAREAARWRAAAQGYLELALAHAERCSATPTP